MKIFLTFIVTLFSMTVFSQTYYYRQTAKVSNGVRSAGNNSGQFITFTKDGCYDSDKEGISVNNGFQNYKKYENGILYYMGTSYWGDQCQYCFNENKDRLNIIPDNDNGVVYVYQRVNAPIGIKSCYYIKSVTVPVYSNPYPPTTVERPTTSHPSAKKTQATMTCPYCNGKGKVKKYIPSPSTFGATPIYRKCEYCGEEMSSGTLHIHVVCSECHGTGVIKLN